MNSNDEPGASFPEAARRCALQMMLNAEFIRRELPALTLPEDLRVQIEAQCDDLMATKHDVFSALAEMTLLESVPESKLSQIFVWIVSAIRSLDELVRDLAQKADHDPRLSLVLILVMESATNILHWLPERPEVFPTADEPTGGPASLPPILPGNKDKRLALAGPNPYAEACRAAKLDGSLEEFLGQVADDLS